MAANSKPESFAFKRDVLDPSNPIPLLIGLAGGTGSGKTYSAMTLATGLAGGKPFAVIDTENGRARHYLKDFTFDRTDLAHPFRPARYEAAILAADAAGYPVIVVDSMSHEWAGDGGVLDWHDEVLERMAGTDYRKREACNFAAWIEPKAGHKHLVTRLLQVRAHVILCFRAEEKIDIVREDGKTKVVPKKSPTGLDGWMPISEKNLPYELTCSFLLTADAPGVPKPIKLQQQHRPFFDLRQQIGRESGARLAEWAAGGTPTPAEHSAPKATTAKQSGDAESRAIASLETAYKAGRDALASAYATIKAYYESYSQQIPLAVAAKYRELTESIKE